MRIGNRYLTRDEVLRLEIGILDGAGEIDSIISKIKDNREVE